jgi:cation transport ATPase
MAEKYEGLHVSFGAEIHPAVDADLLAAREQALQEQEERRLALEQAAAAKKERTRRRFRSAGKQLLRRALVALVIVVLLDIAFGIGLLSQSLVNLLSLAALFWLAIQVGAWLQFVWCKEGLLK